ncbi:MAG TPA: glycosyltransferase family 39 protein [Tepidisphaeraceae bacterium]
MSGLAFNYLSWLTVIRCRLLLAALLLVGFVGHVLYLTIDPPVGLAGDEAHYWDWSRQLDWSYYSKGPAVAVVIRFGRMLFGDTLLGVRFPALLFAVGTSLCTYWLTNRVFKSERLALGTVALTHVVPLFIAGSLLMTIDSPYYFCWATATCFGYLAAVENRRWAWPLAGMFVGLGFLAKYAALLWLVGLVIFLLLRNRPALRTPWPWMTIGIAFAFTTPVLLWNARHDWVSFGHVARSTAEDQNGFNPLKIIAHFGELLGGQVGLLNPIVFAFIVGGVWTVLRHQRRERLLYLLCVALPFFGFVTLVTLRKNTEPNWPAPTYFTLMPLAAWFVARHWPRTRGWLIGAIGVGVGAMIVLHYSTLLYPVVKVPPRQWDASARLVGGEAIGQAVSAQLKTLGPDAMVICDKYYDAGLMAFYVDGRPKTFCSGAYAKNPDERDRLTQYDMWPDRDLSQASLRGRDAVFVGRATADLFEAFDRVEALPDLPIMRRGVLIRRQILWKCYGFRGMTRPQDGRTKR